MPYLTLRSLKERTTFANKHILIPILFADITDFIDYCKDKEL